MSLNTNDLMFEYYSKNADQFLKDFMQYVDTNIPLFALQDELLYLMNLHEVSNFKIPGSKSRDKHDHIFYFEVLPVKENIKVKSYRYIGIDLERKGKLSK